LFFFFSYGSVAAEIRAMSSRSSSANLAIRLGEWNTKVKLFRIETGAQTPQALLTHTCRSELSQVGKCRECKEVIRVTGVQKTGNARGKAATEPKDMTCPHCQATDSQDDVTFCGTCDRVVPEEEIEHRLSFDGHTLKVESDILDAWRALMPEPGAMRVVSVVLRNTLGTYLFDEAYQLVPDKGNAASVALWMQYLLSRRAALIVHFAIKKNFKIAAVYVTHVRGTPVMIVHTLLGFDEIELEPFELPEPAKDLLDPLHTLLQGAWATSLETAVEHPQRRCFGELYLAAEAQEALEVRKIGALPGEGSALAKQLADRLAPPMKKKGKAEEEASQEVHE
jgi:hypothetical protein